MLPAQTPLTPTDPYGGLIDAHAHVVSKQRARRNHSSGGAAWLSHPHPITALWDAQPWPIPVVLVESDRPLAGENQRLIRLAADHPGVLAVIGRLDLASEGAQDRLSEILATPGSERWRGPRHALHPDLDGPWHPRSFRLTSALGATGRVLELLAPADQLREAVRIAAQAECEVVLDHLGLPPWSAGASAWADWETQLANLGQHHHVSVKLGALPADPADLRRRRALDLALSIFGPDRLMFASNWPWPDPGREPGSYAVDWFLGFTEGLGADAAHQIRSDTAKRVYSPPAPRESATPA